MSQQALAEKLLISRGNLAKYEGAVHEPSFELLVRIAKYFDVTVDHLLLTDLEAEDISVIREKTFQAPSIFPVQVDKSGGDIIEVVPHTAQAGYTGMYGDVGFIESLDHMALPFLHTSGKCRAFPISGDSMPPYADGSYVIGEYISNRDDVANGEKYIVLSRDEGIVFKRIYRHNDNREVIMLHSDNPKYSPYPIEWKEVIEVWKFVAAVTMDESDNHNEISDMLVKMKQLQQEITDFTKKFE